MAAARPLPIGVISRSLVDKYGSLLSGGPANQNPVANQNSYMGVYNNATDGSVLRIVAFSAFMSTISFVYLEWVAGNPGVLYTGEGGYGAVDPRTYTTPGQLIIFNSAVCVGSHIGKAIVNPTTGLNYAPDWPIAIIPPAYSFLVQVKNQGLGIEGGIWWLPVPGPLSARV